MARMPMTEPVDLAPARERADLVADLAGFPAETERLLAGVTAEGLRKPASGGGWGVVEVLSHLLDWEEIILQRIRTTIDEDCPDLPAFDGALWDIERDYRSRDPRAVLERFAATRGALATLLAGIQDDAWERVGVHAVHGPVTVEWMARHLRDHSREHLDQIRDALA